MAGKLKTLRATKGHLMADAPMRILPSFTLTAKDLPVIKSWRVGSRYNLEIEVEQVSMSKNEYRENETIISRFKIHKVKDISHSSHKERRGKKGY